MKIFYCTTTNKTYQYYLINETKFTIFSFIEDQYAPLSDITKQTLDSLLSSHDTVKSDLIGINASLFDGISTNNLKQLRCIGIQTLDLSKDSNKTSSEILLGSGERCDMASWVFLWNNQEFLPPINRFILTKVTKSSTARLTSLKGHFTAQITIPFKNSNIIDDANTILLKPGLLGFSSNISKDRIQQISLEQLRNHSNGWDPFPNLKLTSHPTCDSNGTDIKVELFWNDNRSIPEICEVYVKADIGYVNKRKLNLINGKGSFRYIPLGLEKQDIATIKVGFKTYSNVVLTQVKYVV